MSVQTFMHASKGECWKCFLWVRPQAKPEESEVESLDLRAETGWNTSIVVL
jgi:hypothetical protein